MTEQAFILETANISPYHNLAVEKYLCDHVAKGQMILYLWQNQRTVVVGANQNVYKECNLKDMEYDHCYLARRTTGGGAVYHDLGNLNYSFVAGPDVYDVKRQTGVILAALQSLGLAAQADGRNDITIAGSKISGNAYLTTKTFGLQHGTLLYDVDVKRMARYLNVAPDKIQAKGVDSVRSRVANIVDFDPELTLPQLRQALKRQARQAYGPLKAMTEPDDLDDLLEQFHSYKYLYNRNSGYALIVHDYYSFGEAQLYFDIDRRTIRHVDIYTDALDVEMTDRLKAVFQGLRIDDKDFAARVAKLDQPELTADLAAIYRKVKRQLRA